MTKTRLPNNYMRVLRLIPIGKERSQSTKEIADLLKIDVRTVREIVRNLIIKHNIAICGSRNTTGGYYIPSNDTERIEGIRALDKQNQEELKRINALMYADLNEQDKYLKGE